VDVVSVDVDPQLAEIAASLETPGYVEVRVADGADLLDAECRWSMIFADAPAGKREGLDQTVAALEPGGVLPVDDMTPEHFVSDLHRDKTPEVRDTLVADPRLRTVEVD